MIFLSLSPVRVHCGDLILVNARHPYVNTEELPADAQPCGTESPLEPFSPQFPKLLLRRHAATALRALIRSVGGAKDIMPVSGHRTFSIQQEIWNQTIADNGREFTKKYVAFPGCSEHQTGLAVDLAKCDENIDFICPNFPDNGVFRIFRQRAAEYGFILRYPEEKEWLTGIACEPWHFRYVGVPHAEIMVQNGFVLEEYVDFLRQFPHGKRACRIQCGERRFAVSYCRAADHADTVIELANGAPYSLSGNNADGFIVTQMERR